MPNWVQNTLTVIGQMDDVLKFIQKAHSEDINTGKRMIDFNKFIPMPYELFSSGKYWKDFWSGSHVTQKELDNHSEELRKKYGYASWYEFCNAEWGTKWNACQVGDVDLNITNETNSTVVYKFATAWDAPEKVYVKMSTMFPMLRFEVYACEESCEFQWEKVWHNGDLISEVHIPFPPHDEEEVTEDKKEETK